MADELPIIQKTYDLIKWYVPILNRLPHNYRFEGPVLLVMLRHPKIKPSQGA